ncbi:dihydrodipicolinate synthase [Chloroherpeton thalassium ATCC 35110]|uniref:4-hydroxy-tetrahydrodipicolinate synthase n=1 Tax=Chloroherpeton thalassium (strain ATCC 35110 / GB-78) TaxID=517418 RepID=DAPA_CHLT3|nr:4-hydroxy-tetrahydrodipicolinate synthase [Chloroherpeton thalassium]B3QUT2.1 RecName: Full=4-hydroxy-tetrahydrodipicolinate synthase; Short=HTPA synthase [Chloroherpeton thalassium ATCC 35110]ACF14433.1 dihydrodipicolinate synthase [Chloroherpeton thalassium ATCC 35110]
MQRRELSGSAVALVTPFKKDLTVDEEALRRLVNFQIENGTDIIIPCGTTGESPTLTNEEQVQVIKIVCDEARGKAQVAAGAGTNSTIHAIELAKAAEAAGASAILSVAPYYNKPSQEGFYQHYKGIANAVSVPIIIYNVPGRTGSNIAVDTIIRLAEDLGNVLAVKEASGNMSQITEMLNRRPEKLAVLSGDDPLILPVMALGGDGIISVAANQVPKTVKDLVEAMFASDLTTAQKIHNQYYNLFTLNFIESNPVPVKYTLAKMGLIEEVYRLPLVPLSSSSKAKLDAELVQLGLVEASATA